MKKIKIISSKFIKYWIKVLFPERFVRELKGIRLRCRPKVRNYELYLRSVERLCGVEIGGPSDIFKFELPIYSACDSLEFVNFSHETTWEGRLQKTVAYYSTKTGTQHVLEASDLSYFPDNHFDFLISSNCLEHVANPIKALAEWKRIACGVIVLVLPRKESNFDHRRPTTSFSHLLADYNSSVGEDDLTHLDEILELHDLSLDAGAGCLEEFRARSYQNPINRCLHHHVFDEDLVGEICDFLGLKITEQSSNSTDFVFLIQPEEGRI